MRARSRRSASDYFSAAMLELSIMGIFVLIAQPQLRQGLTELVYPPAASSLPTPPVAGSTLGASARLSEAAMPYVAPRLEPLSETPSTLAPQSLAGAGNRSWSMRMASYAPLEKFEAFAVSLPDADRTPATVAGTQVGQQRVARYAPSATATQLTASDWNIAAAAQSPRPLSGWTSSRPADAIYRDSYPPPFGTQSQWK